MEGAVSPPLQYVCMLSHRETATHQLLEWQLAPRCVHQLQLAAKVSGSAAPIQARNELKLVQDFAGLRVNTSRSGLLLIRLCHPEDHVLLADTGMPIKRPPPPPTYNTRGGL